MALLCWSGGCDSTLLLYKLLKSGNPNVRTISFNHHGVGAQFQNRTARGAILKWLSNKGLKVKDHTELTINADYGGHITRPDGLGQPTIWQFNALSYLNKDENLYLGYIKSDCIWHYRTQLFDLFNNACQMLHYTGSLMMPLEWETKSDIIESLTSIGLDKLVWWCEGVGYSIGSEPCGNCSTCREIKAARFLIEDNKVNYIGGVFDETDRKNHKFGDDEKMAKYEPELKKEDKDDKDDKATLKAAIKIGD